MKSKSILIVEDEPNIAEVVTLYLKRADFQVQVAKDGIKAMEILERKMPDLLILDIMLPELDGFAITRWLRERSNVPIIMLTARRDEIDRITGLELGADDYVVKPFSPQELVSRVRAVLRRSGQSADQGTDTEPVTAGDLTINPLARTITKGEEQLSLTAKEFELLSHFATNPGRVFSRAQLLDTVWGYGHDGYEHTVNSHMNRLRAKIEEDPSSPEYILTVWGVGYKFSEKMANPKEE